VDAVKISGSKLVVDADRGLMRCLLGQRDFGLGAPLVVIDFFVGHDRKGRLVTLFCVHKTANGSGAFR